MRTMTVFGRGAPALGALICAAMVTTSAYPLADVSHEQSLSLTPLGTYETHIFDEGASEIVKFDPATQRLFVVNAQAASIDVLDASNPFTPVKIDSISASAFGAGVNSVDISRGVLAAAVEGHVRTGPGVVAFYRTDTLALLGSAPTGALPDMVTFSPNGRFALTANEGEPNSDYSIDPEGSVTVVEIRGNFQTLEATTVGFDAFNAQKSALLAAGVRVYGPGATVAQDFEPEYIAVSGNSREAYVTLQENNAVAVLDLRRLAFTKIIPLGYKDHLVAGQGLDASDRDDAINITTWPVLGMYLPDGIAAYSVKGKTYLVTANEGDAREYDTFEEEIRVKDTDVELDPAAFPDAAALKADAAIGRLNVTTTLGDTDGDGDYDELYALGGRSFSIWDTNGGLVFDSGDALEQIAAAAAPDWFNASNDDQEFDSRSDNKGPEPEGLALGTIRGRTYVFIGLERVGGVVVYDVTTPRVPRFIEYINNRDFTGSIEDFTAGDLGPEGLHFVPAHQSPTGRPMLVVGNEVSGSTTFYDVAVSGAGDEGEDEED